MNTSISLKGTISTIDHQFLMECTLAHLILSKLEKKEYIDVSVKKKAKKGDIIYLENEREEFIYYLVSGKVILCRDLPCSNRIIIDVVSDSNFFGINAVIGSGTNNEYAEALTSVSYVRLRSSTVKKLMKLNGKFSTIVMTSLYRYIDKVERRLMMFHSSKNVKERIINLLLDFVDDFGEKVGMEYKVQLDLTHKELSEMILSSRQSISQIMSDLQYEGLIKYDRNKLLVRDLDKLLKMIE